MSAALSRVAPLARAVRSSLCVTSAAAVAVVPLHRAIRQSSSLPNGPGAASTASSAPPSSTMWQKLTLAGAALLAAGTVSLAWNKPASSQAKKSSDAATAKGTTAAPVASAASTAPAPPAVAVPQKKGGDPARPGARVEGLPEYTGEQVAKHKTAADRIWVSYKEGVYDITEFVEQHPGGKKILLAAGGSIEPFWEMYGVHKQEAVFAMLEEMRIGNTQPAPASDKPKGASEDPYRNDPVRHPALKMHTQKPFNAETPLALLGETIITPTEVFYVRNHLPVPVINEDDFLLKVEGQGLSRSLRLSMEDIRTKFKPHTIIATIQCAGNRRKTMNDMKPLKGMSWSSGAIGTAVFKGARLRDILLYAGVELDEDGLTCCGISHVCFEGADTDPSGEAYGASIPSDVAVNPAADVIIAYEMNGEPLSPDHGFPLRVVVPGTIGARNVKWLKRIVTSHRESDSFWQMRDYKMFAPSVSFENADYDKVPSLQEYPVQSSICDPEEGEVIKVVNNEITIKGYAYSGGGRGIVRVDLSIDGGKTFQEAKLKQVNQSIHRSWAWTLWELTVPVPEGFKGDMHLVCKAVDHAYNSQPESVEDIWNIRGLLNNTWHRVRVTVVNE